CASSLYAVKLACDYLLSHKTDMMLAGAVSAADPLFVNVGFSIFQAYPEQGRSSSPLDRDSAGLVSGEGAGMFVLKRYSDAVRDGDRIRAVIGGIGLSNDGRGQSVLSPNAKGQAAAFERAYADAGIDPTSIQYVECHATGTPVGDKVELDSMDAFFGPYGAAPLVGSVKSNVGHLLTAAGMAGMIKVILSMARGRIPATINLKNPLSSTKQVVAPQQMPTASVAWPAGPARRRAAVSAFGFGGTNAHLILEHEPAGSAGGVQQGTCSAAREKRQGVKSLSPVAIVGMDAFFGPCEGLAAFHRSTYDGNQHFAAVPRQRWKGLEDQPDLLRRFGFETGEAPEGAYIAGFDLDFMRFRVPPNEDDRLIPQQLLALKVLDNALAQADIRPGGNVAVLIAMETELALHQFVARAHLRSSFKKACSDNDLSLPPEQQAAIESLIIDSVHNVAQVNQYTSFIGNIMACRVSSLWDFSGPAFTLSSEENSVFKALDVAQMLLSNGEADAVVVGAVDLAGGPESVLWRNGRHPSNTGVKTLSFDRGTTGRTVGEGAGAVVLKRLDQAQEDQDRIYAIIDAIAFARGTSRESVGRACRRAFDRAAVGPGEIGYLEVFGSGVAQEDEAEMPGLIDAYKVSGAHLQCAVGSVKANIGHTFAASGMASLIKTALGLYHRFIPGTPAWSAPKNPQLWEDSPFYVPAESRPWFLDAHQPKRIAAISGLGGDGTSTHLVLSEAAGQTLPPNICLTAPPCSLLPLAGDDRRALQRGLDACKQEILSGAPPAAVAAHCFEQVRQHPGARYGLSILGNDKDDFIREIDNARTALDRAFAAGEDWATMRGSYFTANPLGNRGKPAFVYPGGFNTYPGLGRTLFHLFPSMYERMDRHSSRVGGMAGERYIYPRSLRGLSERDLNALARELIDLPIVMFESGILFAILYTKIMRDCFRVEPQLALGYSMGEVSMMYALDVWRSADEMSQVLHTSPVFQTRLAGPMQTVREAWNLPGAEHGNEKIWYGYLLRASAERVRPALEDEGRAYLIFVNSPREVVIAGQDRACRRVIEKLGCEHFEVPMGDAIHCELVRADYDELARLHTCAVQSVTGVDFYSADRFAPLPIDAATIADNIAAIYCREIDFPRLVRQAYRDGARIFLELGPRENCTHWIGEILAGRPHLAVGVNRKGADDKTSILRALAMLYSHRIDLDLAPLYERPDGRVAAKKSLIQPVMVGGLRIASAILNAENRRRFAAMAPLPAEMPSADAVDEVEPVADAAETHQERPRPVRIDRALSKTEPCAPDFVRAGGSPWIEQFDHNLSLISACHASFLQTRKQALKQMGETVGLLMGPAGPVPSGAVAVPSGEKRTLSWSELLAQYPPAGPLRAVRTKPAGVIWDYADLKEFAEGNIASVFGDAYAIIDTYSRRVRLPMEPYLLVSRVTRLDARTGDFRPSSITTEYDIPHNWWYSTDGQIPWAVAVESGQCDLLLISYLGIDFECKGDRVYRLLDCTLIFLADAPREGQTLRYDIKINSFARTGGALLFFFSYDCFVKDRLVLQMRGGCAGFFSDAELKAGKGIVLTEQEIEEKRKIKKKRFDPLLTCNKSSFKREDLLELVRCNPAACFGPAYVPRGRNPSLRLTSEPMLMLDRIVSVDPGGGAWGLGLIVAQKDLAPDHWYFPCHFKDDQVLAGSLMAEGCGQLLRFYMLFLGLQTCTGNARFQPVGRLPNTVRCRGQVTPQDSLLTYRMEIREIGTSPDPYAVADVDILTADKIVVDFKNLGVALSEQDTAGFILEKPVAGAAPPGPASDGCPAQSKAPKNKGLRPGPADAPAAGKDKPIVPGIAESPQVPQAEGTLSLKELLARHPAPVPGRARRVKPPGVIWDYADLREFAAGRIADVFGEAYAIIDTYARRVRLPMEPYLLVTRVTGLNAEKGAFKPSSITIEFEIPYNAWYSSQGQVPAAVILEPGQTYLLLISYMGIDLECKGGRVCRLLDGTLTFMDHMPEEGDILRYEIRIDAFTRTGGAPLFFCSYDCFLKDKLLVRMRGGCVGLFTGEELETSPGIVRTEQELADRKNVKKRYFEPLLKTARTSFARADLLELARGDLSACFGPAYDPGATNPLLCFAAEPLLMLDRIVALDPAGGARGLGLIAAEKDCSPTDWYFSCHFKDDPCVPGSLMGEGCLQLLKFYMLFLGLQRRTSNARFQPARRLTQKVRCRGQVTPECDRITYRMEIKEIDMSSSPRAIADVDVFWGDKIVAALKDLGMEMIEKDSAESSSDEPLRAQAPEEPAAGKRPALFEKFHLEKFAVGSIANCFGPDFAIYENRQPPRTPNGDLQLISRVLEVTGKRLDFKNRAAVVSEYDVPRDAWFYRENSHPAVMPYSILMEISLQPCGFISAYMGTTLTAPDIDFCFRNLDGEGTILMPIDLRGKTVTNRSELLSTVTTGNTIVQRFQFELSHQGLPFYRGTAAFGYFLPGALTNQIGLDGGIDNQPLHTKEYFSGPSIVRIDLNAAAAGEQLYKAREGKAYYRLAGPQLDFLDGVRIVERGGKFEQGYVYGEKRIDPTDWFYPCHFYQDPVMPGSLGVESILQAMRVFALQQDLGARFRSPCFTQRSNHRIIWKYRGQLVPGDELMSIEIHVKKVEHTAERVSVEADASLWKNRIRIYEITDAAICLEEAEGKDG
ncbi:MAG: PfaB family protein, partial [Desulfobacterales bacterium]|nr:PfaB family protein [Desulfobacterales bacterium]